MSSKTSGKQAQLEGMSIQCENCSKPIDKEEAIFRCVCCAAIMHMSPSCNEIINALQQVNQNVLLLCNACVQQNKRVVILDTIKRPPRKQNNLEIIDDIQTTIKEIISSKRNARTANDLAIRIRGIDKSIKETARERAEKDIQETLSLSRLKRYSKTVCISKDYSLQEEQQLKNCLKKRKDLINAGFS